MSLAPVLQPRELDELLTSRTGIRLIDVRTPGEFESAHIAGAYNVPLDALGEHAAEIATNPQNDFVLICQSGNRARKAEDALRGSGLTRLHVLDGGMNAWLAANKPARFGPRRMSLERQVRIVAGGLSAIGGLLALLVSPWFAIVPLFVGSGLVFAGVTDTCAMAMVLSRLPHNSVASCDVPAMVQALRSGAQPVPVGRQPAPPAQNCSR